MARMKDRKKRSNRVSVDFTGVEGRIRVPEGDYRVEVVGCELKDGSAAEYLEWKLKIIDGEAEGGILYHNTSLSAQSLWALRSWLESLGVDVEEGEMDIEPEDYIGMEMMVTVEIESYDGKKRSRVTDHFACEEDDGKKSKKRKGKKDDDGDEDEAPKSRRKKGGKRGSDDDGEGDEDEPRSRRGKSSRKSRRDEEEEESEDDDEKPARGGKRSSKKGKKAKRLISADDVGDMDADELGELIEEHELDVDLDEYRNLKKQRAAVLDALEEAELLEEAD